ncbi:hypothetical protein Pst134EB_018572 [Puccinia striiformis f. sp. tritici]|nr:hypothetical protein Pst134EB_018572 [Puccinia striiformis f. sp. tritici]
MSRHHPYSGYDESAQSGGGHRKNGFGKRGAGGRGNNSGGRRGGGGGGGGFAGSHTSSAGSNKSGWDSTPAGSNNPDYLESNSNRSFEHELAHVPRGPSKGFKNRGGKGAKRAGGFPKFDPAGERESISQQIQKERPCRTLFVRNVKYETDSQEVRDKFEQMGEIKTFFDLISTRGMAFVTYYDLRAATMAKQRLQGTDASGRPIDVHYSLPKDNELERRCDRDKNQATLLLNILGANRPIDDNELRAKFETYGEIRSVKPFKDSACQRFVEWWDIRACEAAHDSLDGSQYLGGKLELNFAWDTGMVPKGRPDWRAGQEEDGGGFYGPDVGQDDYEHDDQINYESYAPHNGYPDQDKSNGNGYGPHDPYHMAGQPYNPSQDNNTTGAYANGIDGQRLDQAHKVQELLASLTKASTNGNHMNGGAVPTLVSNYATEPTAPAPIGQSGFAMGTQLPSNFVPNYPTYPAVPQPSYTNSVAPINPAAQNTNQLAQIMGQLSSFTSTPAQQQQQPHAHPSIAPASYAATSDDSRGTAGGSSSAAASLGLPPSVLALLQQNGGASSTGMTGSASQESAYNLQPKPTPPIPTAPRAMQAAAAASALASLTSIPALTPAANLVPRPAVPSYPTTSPQYNSTPVPTTNTSTNPQAAVQQLLALLQQQTQHQQQQQQQQ